MELLGNRLFHALHGSVRFIACEGFPSLFLRACRNEGVRLRYVFVRSDAVEAVASDGDFKKVLAAAAALGMRVEVLSKKGLPQFLRRYRGRYGLPVGLLCAALLLSALSSFVWSVELEGLRQIEPAALSDYLRSYNIKQGVFLCNVDTAAVTLRVEAFDPRIEKADVNIVGCRVFVRVLERELPETPTDLGRYCDLVAAWDGEILKADVTAGEKKVRVGDAVVRGDVLAEGTVPLRDGSFRLTRAQGKIIARTHRLLSCMTAQKVDVFEIVKSRTKYSFCFFGCEFPLPGTNEAANASVHKTNTVAFLKSGDGSFPLGVRTTAVLYLSPAEFQPDREKMLLLCATDLAVRFCEQPWRENVVSCSESVRMGTGMTLEADFVCEENIAQERFIGIP